MIPKTARRLIQALSAACLTVLPAGGVAAQTAVHDSGGELMPEQAAYDVRFYDLEVSVHFADSTISGALTAWVEALRPLDHLVLDLDPALEVDGVSGAHGAALAHRRDGGKLWIDLPGTVARGGSAGATVTYHGRPKAAPVRPGTWSDGFHWAETPSGEPWLGVVSVLDGADIWFPVKDHPSDEPDSMALHVTVPEGLEVASNGRLREVTNAPGGGRTFHWFVSTPINNYDVTIDVAPYRILEDTWTSVTGEGFPFRFWVLPEFVEEGERAMEEFQRHMRFFEETLGPYPFRGDKYGVAQTPYLGMENQSIISYGHDFSANEAGFDWLHFHELSHEWWANMVTAPDWRHWWLHESLGSYMEALYAEHLGGVEAYHAYLPDRPFSFPDDRPIAPLRSQTSREIYGGQIYGKGAYVLHTLRHLIGRETLMEVLRRFAYPDPEAAMEPGCRCRFATTEEFVELAEALSGQRLGWFFDVYLRQPELPVLVGGRREGELWLWWEVPGGLPFPLPVEVDVEGERVRVIPGRMGRLVPLPEGARYTVDPDQWILMEYREETLPPAPLPPPGR